MKLISLKCPDCNAKIEVNPELEKIICNYCGAEIYIDDEASKLDRIESVKLKHRIKNHEQTLKEAEEIKQLRDKEEEKAKVEVQTWLCIGVIVYILIIMIGYREYYNFSSDLLIYFISGVLCIITNTLTALIHMNFFKLFNRDTTILLLISTILFVVWFIIGTSIAAR